MDDHYHSSSMQSHHAGPDTETSKASQERNPATPPTALLYAIKYTDPDAALMQGLDPHGTYLRYQIREHNQQPVAYTPTRKELLAFKENGGRIALPGGEDELPFQLWKARMLPVTRELLDEYEIGDLLG